jgi:hypothetical protein
MATEIPPYAFKSPYFSYDLRCCECLAERPHSEEVHLVLTRGWSPEKAQRVIREYPHACKCGCDIRFGNPVEVKR